MCVCMCMAMNPDRLLSMLFNNILCSRYGLFPLDGGGVRGSLESLQLRGVGFRDAPAKGWSWWTLEPS